MNTDVVRLGEAAAPKSPGAGLRRGWSAVTLALAAGIFLEAAFAGAMLSGASWAREAHRTTALLLVAATLLAGLVALFALRRRSRGTRLGLMLLGLAATLFVQMALGAMSAHGRNLLWLHVPLGVALVGFALQAWAGARRLSAAE